MILLAPNILQFSLIQKGIGFLQQIQLNGSLNFSFKHKFIQHEEKTLKILFFNNPSNDAYLFLVHIFNISFAIGFCKLKDSRVTEVLPCLKELVECVKEIIDEKIYSFKCQSFSLKGQYCLWMERNSDLKWIIVMALAMTIFWKEFHCLNNLIHSHV